MNLSLKEFLQHQRTLSLFRTFLILSRSIQNAQHQSEIRRQIKFEFQKHSNIKSSQEISNLYRFAQSQLKELEHLISWTQAS